jgi:hypothetical protein
MIIDNVFNIKTYLGSEPLPLINAPVALASNSNYITFINNITAIYGTQAVNGAIPTFYKVGNLVDNNSSLKVLEPRKSYYFISKSNVTFPYNIAYSGLLMPFTSFENCPTVNLSNDIVTLTSTSGNYYYMNQNINNLNIGEDYKYSFKVVNSNWPITIVPTSGDLQSSQSANNVGAIIRFDNDANVTNYSTFLPPNTNLDQLDRNNLFGIIEVSVESPSNLGCPKFVDAFIIHCLSCIPARTPTPTPTSTLTPTPTTTPTPTPTPGAASSFDTTLVVPSNSTSASGSGVSISSQPGTSISFNSQPTTGQLPAIMYVYVSNVAKASINFFAGSVGQSIQLIINGVTYNTTFTSGRKDL